MKLGKKLKGGTKLSLRFLWYLGASILILSLPTFSYLVPRVDPPAAPAAPLERSAPSSSSGGYEPSSTRAASSRGFIRPSRPTGLRSAVSSAKRAVRPQTQPQRPPRRPSRQQRPSGNRPDSPAETEQGGERPRQRSEQPAPVSGVAPGATLPVPAAMAQQLQALQQEFEQVQQNLFPQLALGLGPARGNPFQEAIENEPPPAVDPTPEPTPPADTPPTDAIDEVPPDVPQPQPPDEVPDVGSGGDGAPAGAFDFLITGHFSEAPTRLWRARRESTTEFALEDSGTINFFPGFITSFVTFDGRDKVVITDLNRDGLDDFVVARLASGVGTSVESYLGQPQGNFKLHASTTLYLRAVRSLALFDFDNNGEDELALLLEGQPHLFVYEREEEDWQYRREIVLPWDAAILLKSTAGAAPRTTNLYLLDNAMNRVVAISSRAPSAFVYGLQAPLSFMRFIEVEFPTSTVDQTAAVVGFLLPDQVVLVEQTARGASPFVVFDQADQRMPTSIIGDYSGIGERQLIWIP